MMSLSSFHIFPSFPADGALHEDSKGYMGFLLEAFRTSIHLILSFDPEIYAIVLRSLEFSLWATDLPVLLVLFGSVWCARRFSGGITVLQGQVFAYHPAEYDHGLTLACY